MKYFIDKRSLSYYCYNNVQLLFSTARTCNTILAASFADNLHIKSRLVIRLESASIEACVLCMQNYENGTPTQGGVHRIMMARREYNTSIARPITHAYNIVRARIGQREGVCTKKSSFPYEKGSSFSGYWLSIQSRCFVVCFTREQLYCVHREKKNRYMTIGITIKGRKGNHFVDNTNVQALTFSVNE